MPQIVLRKVAGKSSPEDIVLSVQDRTIDYLKVTITPEVRVSAFFEKDYERVDSRYAELFVEEGAAFTSTVVQIIPGSRTRQGIELPGAMKIGEQLTILVKRTAL